MASNTLRTAEEKMKGSIEALKKDLATIRTGRASPALIQNLRVDYAGTPTPLIQMAGIATPQSRLLVVQPWDKSTLSSIEKAILKSDLGLTPVSDGTVIRINIPPITEERRQELMKVVRKRVEEKKVAIRNVRRDSQNDIKGLEKNKEISQDESKRSLDYLQKLTDKYIVSTDEVGREKEKELAEV